MNLDREKLVKLAIGAGFDQNNFCSVVVRHTNGSWVGIYDELAKFAELILNSKDQLSKDE